jgi:hypothetical protein
MGVIYQTQLIERRSYHDVRAAFSTLELILSSAKDGYKFDDSMRETYLTRFEEALEVIRAELDLSLAGCQAEKKSNLENQVR